MCFELGSKVLPWMRDLIIKYLLSAFITFKYKLNKQPILHGACEVDKYRAAEVS